MKMKLRISNDVTFPVEFTVQEGNQQVEHKFTLTCERLPKDALTGKDAASSEKLISSVLLESAKGWNGQQIVVDENDKPLDFSKEAFQVLLSLPFVDSIIYKQYFQACGARAKN